MLALDSLINLSTGLTTQLRRMGVIPGSGIKPEYGGTKESTPKRPMGTQAVLGGKPVYWTGDNYGWQSGGAAAKAGLLGSEVVGDAAFNPASVYASAPSAPVLPASASSPADRAYRQEVSRVAQLTAQDPELQRYETARKAAKTQEEMNSVRDMGMQMWQEKYGKTPMGQPGGAVGSFNPLMQKTFRYQTGGAPGSTTTPGEVPLQSGDLGTRAMADTGYDPAAYGITPEMIEKIKEQSLVRAKK
jgi:hypothetical protein